MSTSLSTHCKEQDSQSLRRAGTWPLGRPRGDRAHVNSGNPGREAGRRDHEVQGEGQGVFSVRIRNYVKFISEISRICILTIQGQSIKSVLFFSILNSPQGALLVSNCSEYRLELEWGATFFVLQTGLFD